MPTKITVKGKEYWRARWSEKGQRKTRRFLDYAEAERFETAMRGIIPTALLRPTGRTEATLINLFAGYVNAAQNKGLGNQSIAEKKTVFEAFMVAFGPDTLAQAVGYADVEAFLGRLAEDKTRARANRYRVHLVAAWGWGRRAFGLPDSCPWSVDRFKVDKPARYVPSRADFWKVHDAADEWDRRLLLTYLHTAARKGELLSLTWDDVDLATASLRLSTRKRSGGMESDIIPMTNDVREALEAQKRAMCSGKVVSIRRERLVFVSPEHGKPAAYFKTLMRELCRAAGVRPFGFHAIRHLSASILAESGMPPWQTQLILRHRNITTTQGYVHSLTGIKVDMDGAFGGSDVRRQKACGQDRGGFTSGHI